MAIYLLPTYKSGYLERRLKRLATSGVAADDLIAIPEPNTASALGKTESFTKWKTLKVEGIKGGMRWM